jgi:hypothetical protein
METKDRPIVVLVNNLQVNLTIEVHQHFSDTIRRRDHSYDLIQPFEIGQLLDVRA